LKDKYFITITTVNGTKHYTFHQIIKTIIVLIIIFLLLLFGGGYLYIQYLKSKVKEVKLQKEKLNNQIFLLHQQLKISQKEIEKMNNLLLNKKVELKKLAEKINDLETKMGLKGDTYFSNINVSSLTTQDINTILTLYPSGVPVKNFKITSKFGWRINPILKKREFHPGIDLRAVGKVPVYATANGIVEAAGLNAYGYGYVVKIINGYGFKTLYAHLQKNLKVKRGDFVKKGQLIGYMGNTGLSTGQHLHYEIRYNDKPLNPINFMYWNGKNFFKIFNKEKGVPWESLVKATLTILKQQH